MLSRREEDLAIVSKVVDGLVDHQRRGGSLRRRVRGLGLRHRRDDGGMKERMENELELIQRKFSKSASHVREKPFLVHETVIWKKLL